jgi:nucleoside-diphosphate-sugar epimerase
VTERSEGTGKHSTQQPFVPRRVLVTGAFGLIGGAVVAALRAQDIAVTALTKQRPDPEAAADIDRIFIGDAGDVDLVRRALADADAVAHLAALPSPNHADADEVFTGNTRATFVVLDEAGRAGVGRVMIASSYSILGLPWARRRLHPPYYPIDEHTPLQIEDPYGLSKQVDEATAAMVGRAYGTDIVALRFPFVGGQDRIQYRLAETLRDPGSVAAESWTYLDVRDAGEVTYRALMAPLRGVHRVFVAAPEILAPYPTEDLIRTYHADSELRRPIPGRAVPLDLAPAGRLLGFTARHVVPLETRPLPGPSGGGAARSCV